MGERAAAIRALHKGYDCALPAELLHTTAIQGWLRQLITRMLSCDAWVRPTSADVLCELTVGLGSRGRRNPFLGTAYSSSAQLTSMAEPSAACRNPYVGFFLDH